MNKISQETEYQYHNQTRQQAKNIVLRMIADQWLLKIISFVAILYLLAVPLGRIKNKFEPTDVIIFIVVLLFNSGLLERISELEYGGLKVKLDELTKEQETQKDNIAANTKIIQRLTALEQTIASHDQEKQVLYENLLDKNEPKHLQRLASDQQYLHYEAQKTFKQELRRLRALGFIENYPNKQISLIPNQGNLRDYVRITDRGKEYLNLIGQAEQR